MKIVVTLEQRFDRTPDGAVWTQVAYAYAFWKRYLAVFEQVQVLARVRETPIVPDGWQRADGENVSFAKVPDYKGPLQYLMRARSISRVARSAWHPGDAVIVRVPSAIGAVLVSRLNRERYPYAVQVVGDPLTMFAPGAVDHPLRVFWRWWFSRQLKRQCAQAAAAAYVTKYYLQRGYPCPAYSVAFSDVELDQTAFVGAPRVARTGVDAIRLIAVGSLAQPYKGLDVLIQALGLCRRRGANLELVVVGDGRYRASLEAQARALELVPHVHFRGQLTAGDAVQSQLDQADIFVLPSRAEGLPRALLEAMARGLPCIGSTVGGIPELLDLEDLVPPGDAAALALRLAEVIRDPGRMVRMSKRSLERATSYRMENLQAREFEFSKHIRQCTESWIRRQKQGRLPVRPGSA
jgi:glycosyltransferase involved in cell wall biosynthesis